MAMAEHERGNMAFVYRQLSRDAERRIQLISEKTDPLDAEILDATPCWHVVVTVPNHENIAAAHLIGRRFGIYLPELKKQSLGSNGRVAHNYLRPMFPGYLFIFVWGINQHWARIRACPGVVGILLDSGKAAVVSDRLIVEMQVRETVERERHNIHIPRRRRAHWRRRRLDEELRTMVGDRNVSISSYSALGEIEGMDDKERISLLHRALGLEMITAS
jgi:transcription antitermination factor NusG